MEKWIEAAQYWEKHAIVIRQIFHPITEMLAESVSLRPSDAVLDIAAGIGEPSLSLAKRWLKSGWVCSTDAIPQMLSVAKAEAQAHHISNVSFVRCLGDCLSFRDAIFDAAVCRLGIMFFSDPLVAVQEALRTLKPGGRLAYAVWHRSDANPFFNIVTRALERHISVPPFDPDAPGAFRFAEPQRLSRLLQQSGAVSVKEGARHFQIVVPLDIEGFWALRGDLSEILREQKSRLPSEKLAEVADDFKAMARPFFSSGQLSLPAEVLIVSGIKPH